MKGKDVAGYVEQALDTGFSHIDTAACELESLPLRIRTGVNFSIGWNSLCE